MHVYELGNYLDIIPSVTLPQPRAFVIFHHPKVAESQALAQQIVAFLQERGLTAENCFIDGEPELPTHQADILISLGGDGTMLRVSRIGALHQQPVLGINLGRLGFLVEVQPDNWQSALLNVINGDYRIEDRLMLHIDHSREGVILQSFEALNEVVLGRGSIVRPVRLQTTVDGELLTTYVADGLIVATPTGSTAYALAAGGPILPPQIRNLLLVPISPHLSFDRSIVLPPEAVIEITVRTDHEAVFSIDGQISEPLQDRDTFHIRLSDQVARFISLRPPNHFYKTLVDSMGQNPSADKAK
jgi:NAD+ kinase